MKRKLLILYIIALPIVIGVLVFKTDFLTRVYTNLGLIEPGRNAVLLTQRLLQERRDPHVPDGASIFLGDSITHGLATAAIADYSVNFGIGQQTAAQLATSISRYKSLQRAGRIYLSIGTNDLGLGNGNSLKNSFKKILSEIPLEIPLIWSAIMPRTELMPEIKEANFLIANLCAERPQCVFIDVYDAMTDTSGQPLHGIYTDGVHPSEKGYAIWIQTLQQNND